MDKLDASNYLTEKGFGWIAGGTRVLMKTLRSKEGGASNRPDRRASKKVSMNHSDFLEIFSQMVNEINPGERIYCTVNSRDFDKAIRKFKELQLENDYHPSEIKYQFYVDIYNRWISSLMKPTSKHSNYFLIDIDNDDKNGLTLEAAVKEVESAGVGLVKQIYPTKNGHHIITEPFNYGKTNLKKWDNVKTDGMALLYFDERIK